MSIMAAHTALADSLLLNAVRDAAAQFSFSRHETVRCVGTAVFKSQDACDYACLLDIDPSVTAWECLPLVLRDGSLRHVPDFLVRRSVAVDAIDVQTTTSTCASSWIDRAAQAKGIRYQVVCAAEFQNTARLRNAQDLLRYVGTPVSLGDRVRVLTALEEVRSLPISAAITCIRDGREPIAVIAAMILQRLIEIDLDEGLIGPDSRITRKFA